MDGTAMKRWLDLLLECFRRMNNNLSKMDCLESQMETAGFVDIQERKFDILGNTWAQGERQKLLGGMMLENISSALHGVSIDPSPDNMHGYDRGGSRTASR